MPSTKKPARTHAPARRRPAGSERGSRQPSKAPVPTAAPAAMPAGRPKAEPASQPPKRISALEAAAIVLAKSGKPMRPVDMLEQMRLRGLWRSPKGKTPGATLYAAIIRDIAAKGKASRFAKHDRGVFVATAAAK